MPKSDYPRIIAKVQEELQAYEKQGYGKPTLRSMFYRLASKNIIANTNSAYRSLMGYCTDARWKGDLKMDCFSDESRYMIADFEDQFSTPEELIDGYFEKMENLSDEYTDKIPRWHKQKHYVEVWIEKKAMINNFVPILSDRDVAIVPTSGYNSLPALFESFKRLLYQHHELHKTVHVLYYGDFDPSGEGMDDDLKKRFKRLIDKYKLSRINFEIDFRRIAVTKDQIKQYNLPTKIDATTHDKLKRAPRSGKFLEKHGELRQVELDALPAIVPDEFRQLILDSVDQFFDEDIHKKMLKEIEEKYSPDQIKEIVKDKFLAKAKNYSDEK